MTHEEGSVSADDEFNSFWIAQLNWANVKITSQGQVQCFCSSRLGFYD